MNPRTAAVLLTILLLPPAGFAQSSTDSLAALLEDAQGAERLPLLVDLAAALQTENPEQALTYGREAKAMLDARSDPALARRLWLITGQAHREIGRHDSTLAHAEQLRAWAEANGDARGLADAAYLRGSTYRIQRLFEEALPALEDARRRYEALGLDARSAETYRTLGRTHSSAGNYEKALAAFERSLALYEAIGDRGGAASALSSTAIARTMQGDLEEAANAFTRVLEVREEIGDEEKIASALGNLGALRFEQGQLAEALALQQRALAIFERLGDTSDLAFGLHNVGIAHNALGDHAAGLRALMRSAELYEQIGDDVRAATAFSNAGLTHSERGELEQALALQQRALALSEQADYPTGVALALNRMGTDYRDLGRYDEALDMLRRALTIHEELGNDVFVSDVLLALGSTYRSLEQYTEASEALTRALTIAAEMGDERSQAVVSLQIGDLYLAQGELGAALSYTDEGLARAEAAGMLVTVRNAHEQRAAILELQERFAEALAAHRAFKATHDSLFTSESQSVVAELQAEFQAKEQRQRIELLEREREVQRLWVGGLLGGLVLLSLLAGLAVNRYRLKQRANVILTRARDDLEAAQARLRAEKQKTDEQAAQLAALDEAKSRFFANVSHEFRTPLTLTLGPLEDLRAGRHGALSDEGAEQVETALRNSRRLLRLVNQLLDVARLESGHTRLHLSPGDLVPYLRSVAEPFVGAVERRRITLSVDLPDTSVPVRFDPDHLDQAVANLLSNALKFTPEGGTVSLAVRSEDGEAVVTVRDTERGIAPGDMEHLFERFFQGEKSELQPGTGIGLALAKELAELHGGGLTAESELGVGSTFTLRLPLADEALPQSRDADSQGDGEARTAEVGSAPDLLPHGSEKTNGIPHATGASDGQTHDPDDASLATDDDRTTVLVVDDNPDIRTYVRRHLETERASGDGYRVVEAADGEAALDAVRERLPDLVVSDVMMPRRDGFSLLEALRSDPETDFVPIVLLTARAEAEDRLAGLGLGADDYLTKPFDARELVARVDNLIAQRQRLRERFAGASESGSPIELHPAPVQVESADAEFLETVRVAIEANLSDENFGVDALAEAVGRSRSSLHQRLSDLTDESPSALLRRMRLERGAYLLREGAGTVSEVAYASGFKSVSHFSSSFRRHFGQTPTAWTAEHA